MTRKKNIKIRIKNIFVEKIAQKNNKKKPILLPVARRSSIQVDAGRLGGSPLNSQHKEFTRSQSSKHATVSVLQLILHESVHEKFSSRNVTAWWYYNSSSSIVTAQHSRHECKIYWWWWAGRSKLEGDENIGNGYWIVFEVNIGKMLTSFWWTELNGWFYWLSVKLMAIIFLRFQIRMI